MSSETNQLDMLAFIIVMKGSHLFVVMLSMLVTSSFAVPIPSLLQVVIAARSDHEDTFLTHYTGSADM